MAMSGGSSRSDVLIIGAGPAGCAAAIECALAGLNVRLVEREMFPRYRPGETLHPGIEPLMVRLGVSEAVGKLNPLRHEGHWAAWNGYSEFLGFGRDEHGPWRGFQIEGAQFDAALLARARELGVRVDQPCRVVSPIVRKRRAVGLRTTHGVIASDVVIDAAGGQHWLARRMGLRVSRATSRLIARYGYVRDPVPTVHENPIFETSPDGWTWLARVKPGVLHWTTLELRRPIAGQLRPNGPPPSVSRLRTLGRIRSADVTWRLVPESAGPGYFLAGDSAAVLDPASSHGVIKAIMSGMLAAQATIQALRSADAAVDLQKGYKAWIAATFCHDVVRLGHFYEATLERCHHTAWRSVGYAPQ
jgi:flavin-dependent dehydrogenase